MSRAFAKVADLEGKRVIEVGCGQTVEKFKIEKTDKP